MYQYLVNPLYQHALYHLETACGENVLGNTKCIATETPDWCCTSLKACDCSGNSLGRSASPRPLTKQLAISSLLNIRSFHYVTKYVTFGFLLHGAFVADEIYSNCA